ncbi:MAG: NAD-dependent epimerase/dehydratase family protein [Deltaproteobacteria bacterium]|nr:NAD-dependent epimerase/dehydratase family protein [Deltaproteobacteria bacterium]
MVYLVTGCAGFIGFHVAEKLLFQGNTVIGIDNLNKYYSVKLKKDRLSLLLKEKNFSFRKLNIAYFKQLEKVFETAKIDIVCHLAAQAGVRYSLTNPFTYEQSNIRGFLNIIELSCRYNVNNFVYASSSSVYGGNEKIPFSADDTVEKPLSLYGATKKADELMAYAYHHLYHLNTTGLRFFTVYGPWGRPDMALFKFTKAITEGKIIEVYNYGKMERDFTYIDDIVDGTITSLNKPFEYEIFNLGRGQSIPLERFISCIEKRLNKKSRRVYLPLQKGDVPKTYADIRKSERMLGFHPKVSIEEGIERFVSWYMSYYNITL